MIQRIQSIYLLTVTILQAILFFTKQATFVNAEGTQEVLCLAGMWFMAIPIGATALIALISIFLYRNRIRQIRLTALNAILLVLLQGTIIYLIVQTNNNQDITPSITAIFPIISAILSYLAIRNIRKDEEKVRSLDRIR